jgi:hypothetical protein
MTRRRLAAMVALVLTPLAVLSAVFYVTDDPWQAISMLISFALAVAAGWFGLVRRGALRVAGLVVAALLAAGVVESLLDSRVLDRVIIIGMCQRSREFPSCDHENSPPWEGWLRPLRSCARRVRWPRMR